MYKTLLPGYNPFKYFEQKALIIALLNLGY